MDDDQYRSLCSLRSALRGSEHERERRCREAGISMPIFELLLVVRAHAAFSGPSLGSIARELHLRPSTVVGIVNQAVDRALIERRQDRWDQRVVRLRLTPTGARVLEPLAESSLEGWEALREVIAGACAIDLVPATEGPNDTTTSTGAPAPAG